MLPKGKTKTKATITSQDHVQQAQAGFLCYQEDAQRGPRAPPAPPPSAPGPVSPGPRGPQSSLALHAGVHSSQGFVPLCFFLPSGVPGQTSACPRLSAGSSGESRAGEPSAAWGFAVLGPRSFLSVQKPRENRRGHSTCSFPSHNSSLHTDPHF